MALDGRVNRGGEAATPAPDAPDAPDGPDAPAPDAPGADEDHVPQLAEFGLAGDRLRSVLVAAKQNGFLGPGPVDAHIAHADAHLEALGDLADTDRIADLGSGGGIPALWFALARSGPRFAMIESSARRAAFLRGALESLGLVDQVDMVEARTETYARGVGREAYSLITARSFAAPPVAAENAAGLVSVGGRAIISSSPDGESAWDRQVLASIGFGSSKFVKVAGRHFMCLTKTGPCPANYPRRAGQPARRPLW